jgi:hypothetical protein
MSRALLVLSVAFGAYGVWLTVRIANRRERWAKRLAVATVMATTLYPLSLGPACWLAGENETALAVVPNVYYPILWLARAGRPPTDFGRIDRWIEWYSTSGRSDGGWPVLTPKGEKLWVVPPDMPH